MRDDPGLDTDAIAGCLAVQYGIGVSAVTFLPIGYDLNAWVYEVVSTDGAHSFLKIRSNPVHEPGLRVPRALLDLGIQHVLAPLRTRSKKLWCPLPSYAGYSVVLYPFVQGESAMIVGLCDDQWREFGSALRAVHASQLEPRLRASLRVETFMLPSAAVVRRVLPLPDGAAVASATAEPFLAFWRAHTESIGQMLARAEDLGTELRSKTFDDVLCHSDIHAANILVGEDGRIWLVDWDGPILAPRERDLLFVIGSRIARVVTPRDEALFFAGYGTVEIDLTALIYYRYERIIEDIGEMATSILFDPRLSERARAEAAERVMSVFTQGGAIEQAEVVVRQG